MSARHGSGLHVVTDVIRCKFLSPRKLSKRGRVPNESIIGKPGDERYRHDVNKRSLGAYDDAVCNFIVSFFVGWMFCMTDWLVTGWPPAQLSLIILTKASRTVESK